ncbi:hypothetical protein CFP56_023196 [Quercus suber]|uniref:Uncharacterized protein n=1 Tax=Quercus suber TaxID=58331 RepID=A0AAW0K989_QUESU
MEGCNFNLYNKKHELALKESSKETGKTVVDKLREDLMKYWMMAHTCSPQFVMGRSVTCTASGAFCLLSAATLAEAICRSYFFPSGESDYKWSTTIVLVIQTIAVGVGTLGPACRWFTAINFSCPKRGNTSHTKHFKVEHYWIQRLVETKECPLTLQIRNRHYRKLAHDAKIQFLHLCIGVQTGIVITSKVIQLISVFIVSQIFLCCNCWEELKKKFKLKNSVSYTESTLESQLSSKLDLSRFVLHLEGEDVMVGLMMKCKCDPTEHWIRMGGKKQPKYLINLLETSTFSQGFKGVGKYDSNQVPSLDSEEPPNCWVLPVVTLTSIAVAIPNVSPKSIKQLICGVNQGLEYVRLIEEYLDGRDLSNIRKTAEVVWLGVELYHKWLDVDLHKLSLQGKSPKEILQELADTAKNRSVEFHKKQMNQCLKQSPSKWPIKVLAANSMYRISQTILLNCESINDQMGEKLFAAVVVMISDILGACLTNLHHLIPIKCLSSTIEERQEA